jgi:protein SCO1/2
VISRGATLIATAVGAAALGLAAWLYLDSKTAPPPAIAGYVLAQPRALPAVDLVDQDAAKFRSADFAGQWSFLYFGYTYCPDVCPLTLVELAGLKRQLAAELPAEPIAYYLISVDPHRDTPERLREYVLYFDPAFRGLTGSETELAALARATETVFDVPEDQADGNYLVSHSSNVVLLNPQGEVHAMFTPPHDSARLAADFARVAAHYAARR